MLGIGDTTTTGAKIVSVDDTLTCCILELPCGSQEFAIMSELQISPRQRKSPKSLYAQTELETAA